MAIAYGGNIYYGDGTAYYGARIDYTVTYPSNTVARVEWVMRGYHNKSLYDSVNNGGCSAGDLKGATSFGSKTYSDSGAASKTYASGTKDFTRSYYNTIDVDQNFWIENLADGSGGGARSTANLSISLSKRPSTTPEKPAAPSVSVITKTGAKINMTLPANRGATIIETLFRVYTAASGGTMVYQDTDTGSAYTSDTASGLTPGTTYYAAVLAKNYNGWSEESARTPFTTAAATAPDQVATPTITGLSSTGATVNWVAPGTNGAAITGYIVEVATSSSFSNATMVLDTTVSAATLSRVLTGLTPATQYWARITAQSSAGESDPGTVSFTTSAGAPDAPAWLTLSDVSATTKDFSFAASVTHGSAVTGYQVQIATDAGFTTVVYDVISLATSRTATGLVPDAEHWIRVRALSAGGNSGWISGTFETVPGMWTNDAGTWKELELWFNDAGAWDEYELWFNDAGTWTQII